MDTNNMNQNQQNTYQQANYVAPAMQQTDLEAPVSLGEWMLTYLLMAIPCVNLVMLFVWAFGNGAPKSKSNWAKAALIWILIGVVLSVIWVATVGASIIASLNELGY